MKRRSAIQAGILAGAVTHSAAQGPIEVQQVSKTFSRPVFIATWNFGKAACEKSREVLLAGGSLRDAVERGINVTELDETNRSVGYGGSPNADGVVQLDACFMDGCFICV